MKINQISKILERAIIYALIVMMAIVLILATIELGYYLVLSILGSDYLLIDLDVLMDLFGVFLLVLIGIELLDTIKVYLKDNVVHVEVVVLVAIIAIARKVVVLKVEEMDGARIASIGLMILALAISYFLIKRTGMAEYKMTGFHSIFRKNRRQAEETGVETMSAKESDNPESEAGNQ